MDDAKQPRPEDYIDTVQAAKIAPGRPAPCVVWRWMSKGIRDRRSGQQVTLKHIPVGGKLFTTAAWMAEFLAEIAKARSAAPPPRPRPTSRTIRRPSQKRREKQIAQAKLALSRS